MDLSFELKAAYGRRNIRVVRPNVAAWHKAAKPREKTLWPYSLSRLTTGNRSGYEDAFRVEISEQAARDAEEILDWLLTRHAGKAAIDWFPALDDAFASLAEFPERCSLAPENTRFPRRRDRRNAGRRQNPNKLLLLLGASAGQDAV